jgi:hypothetical protein
VFIVKKNIRVPLQIVKENILSTPHKVTERVYVRKEKKPTRADYDDNNNNTNV